MRAKKIAPAAPAAVTSKRPGFARSGDSPASTGRPGFISGLFRRHSDPVEAHPVGAAVPESDQGWGPAPERWESVQARGRWVQAVEAESLS